MGGDRIDREARQAVGEEGIAVGIDRREAADGEVVAGDARLLQAGHIAIEVGYLLISIEVMKLFV